MTPASTNHPRLDLLKGIANCLDLQVARRIFEYRFDDRAQARLSDLATRSSEGTLSADEREEYRYYVNVIDFIGLLKAKARKFIESSDC